MTRRRGLTTEHRGGAPALSWSLLFVFASCASTASRPAPAGGFVRPAPAAAPARSAPSLSFADLFEPGSALIPTGRARDAAGREVKMVGYMVKMEIPSPKAFYLAARPLTCDEAGGGTADLAPAVVRVHVPWSTSDIIPHVPGPIEVVGTFTLGPQAEGDGRVSHFRITVPVPERKKFSTHASSSNSSTSLSTAGVPHEVLR